jgi:hypothetical protein
MAFSLIKGHLEIDFLTKVIWYSYLDPRNYRFTFEIPKLVSSTWQTIHHQTCWVSHWFPPLFRFSSHWWPRRVSHRHFFRGYGGFLIFWVPHFIINFRMETIKSIIELDDGKIYRKALYLMVKTMVSCRFSLKPIQWINQPAILGVPSPPSCGGSSSRLLKGERKPRPPSQPRFFPGDGRWAIKRGEKRPTKMTFKVTYKW